MGRRRPVWHYFIFKETTMPLKWPFSLGGKTLLLAAQPCGGQAVMEGVMMRSPNSFAIAVNENGAIVVREDACNRFPKNSLFEVAFTTWRYHAGREHVQRYLRQLSAAQVLEDEDLKARKMEE